MKCAAELTMIKLAAEVAYRLEEERLDEECRKRYDNIVKNTINFCENTINAELEAQARNRSTNIEYSFKVAKISDRLNHQYFCLLKPDGKKYANGTLSMIPDTSCTYDYETFKTYLGSFCIDIDETRSYYDTYGSGTQSAIRYRVYIHNS